MAIVFDPTKRLQALRERGLDFAAAGEIFDGPHLTVEDDRFDYGETRFFTVGYMSARMVVVVWTPRGSDQRIISMRKANDREQTAYGPRLASS
ncbi:BrnT family toxin [Pseudorhizobium pelagicum]|uniref:BrnT family toxin n=1 Tax=Pseudorhizobium pelagicum TaxID=1509405 RepID=A0A922T5L3_9HYPH|nr:BrnT family toxin [Pseudorhizobium pelagicum]KEQ05209.1 hypothetical protein GV67_05465 [Pseudorhizobium pelagicum]KEQ07946.1 hypothetical protein GV68_03995 [Pseudorhizobium pelagicum]